MAWCAGFGRLGGIGGPLIGGLLIASGLALDTIFHVLTALAAAGSLLTLLVPSAGSCTASSCRSAAQATRTPAPGDRRVPTAE